ncbi:MAG TPA: hypothetical protein VGJ20_01890 [Xanthobacteraceae bacterium]|jgi:hypothetical protein
MNNRRVIPTMLPAVGLLAAALSTGPAAMASTRFDGIWSVLIITDAGNCDRGYRYALHIENGRIRYDDPSFDISGQVTARGEVRVIVRAGQQQAIGTGRLSAGYGTGHWSGHSTTAQCSGHWQAERRG